MARASRLLAGLTIALLACASGARAAKPRPLPGEPSHAALAAQAEAFWAHGDPTPSEVKDPLFGRRVGRQEAARAPQISSNADALLYRLWGLQPLQLQVVRRGEAILEVWVRPRTRCARR